MSFAIAGFIPYLLAAFRYLLAGLFIVASIQKIQHPKLFVGSVKSYRLLPQFAITPFSFLLPWVELVLGILLCIGWYTQPAAAITCGLYAVFIGAMAINLVRGRKDLDCGCFAPSKKHTITPGLIVRDIGLSLIAGVVAMWGGGNYVLETLSGEAQGLLVYWLKEYLLPIALIFTGVVLVYKLFNQTLRLVYLSTKE